MKHPHTPRHSKKNNKTSKFYLFSRISTFSWQHSSRLFPTSSRIGFICCPPSRHTIQSGFWTCANNRKRKIFVSSSSLFGFFLLFFFFSSSLPIKAVKEIRFSKKKKKNLSVSSSSRKAVKSNFSHQHKKKPTKKNKLTKATISTKRKVFCARENKMVLFLF